MPIYRNISIHTKLENPKKTCLKYCLLNPFLERMILYVILFSIKFIQIYNEEHFIIFNPKSLFLLNIGKPLGATVRVFPLLNFKDNWYNSKVTKIIIL